MVSATEYQRAVEAFAQEHYEEAVRLFGKLVDNRPVDPNLRLWLASAQQQVGRQDLARGQYEVVLGLSADPEILQTAQKALQRIDIDAASGWQPQQTAPGAPGLGGSTEVTPVAPQPTTYALEAFEKDHSAESNDLSIPDHRQAATAEGWNQDSVHEERLLEPNFQPIMPSDNLITEPPTGGWFADRSLGFKQRLGLGALTLTTVAAVNGAVYYTVLTSGLSAEQQTSLANNALVGGLAGAGIAGAATLGIAWLLNRSVVRPVQQLQRAVRLVAEGNVEARIVPHAADEVGQLAASFNKIAADLRRNINSAEAETGRHQQDKERLQEEIIHLLDQVEGASRGDLTVRAEVSASLTGAVADAFNVTIANLHRIVVQVKRSVARVNQDARDSESFARGLSREALRQAEEISTSRRSVEKMTRSIQQVAENARRAETVTRQASETAARGGDAVDRTVEGILSLRETVSETGKKVKRLAESTQEISKIVALINQLSSRTNLLALNASIEAVRAGEAGRGFAIVADEVRQLADRAAKATREIEQIVLNIQSETSAVMQAMEKGTQQVVVGTRLAEEARQSLDEIIQVSQQIDGLVAEIAQAAVAQETTSRSVEGVMESVEVMAQATAVESNRVSDALGGLVQVAQDLQVATDRFKVEPNA